HYTTAYVRVYGYAGDGTVDLDDATRPGVFLGAYNPDALGARSVALDRQAIATLVGSSSYLGLRLVGADPTNTAMYSPLMYNAPKLGFLAGEGPGGSGGGGGEGVGAG